MESLFLAMISLTLIFLWNNFVQAPNLICRTIIVNYYRSQEHIHNPYNGYLVVQLNVVRLEFSFSSEKQSHWNTGIIDWLT